MYQIEFVRAICHSWYLSYWSGLSSLNAFTARHDVKPVNWLNGTPTNAVFTWPIKMGGVELCRGSYCTDRHQHAFALGSLLSVSVSVLCVCLVLGSVNAPQVVQVQRCIKGTNVLVNSWLIDCTGPGRAQQKTMIPCVVCTVCSAIKKPIIPILVPSRCPCPGLVQCEWATRSIVLFSPYDNDYL